MKKKIFLLLIIIIIVIVSGSFFAFFNKDKEMDDASKFKHEYESLNNTIRESDGATYNNVSIDKNNPIKYVSIDETIELLDSEKAIIYVGANWCPWCRSLLAPMFDSAKKLDIKTIYYLNLDNDKTNYEIQNGELKQISRGSQSYYKLLERLNDYLKDYELTDENGNLYSTGEKRIYMPFFITVKNGNIVEAKGISRTLEEGQTKYSDMTKKQYNDLYNTFYETFSKIYSSSNTCSLDNECS